MSAEVWKMSVCQESFDRILIELDKLESTQEFVAKVRDLSPISPRPYSFRRAELQARCIANRFATMAEKEEENACQPKL